MPATASRPPPVSHPLLSEGVPRRHSPPPYSKLTDSKPTSPASPPKPALSPRTEKRPPHSPPPDFDEKKLDRRPASPQQSEVDERPLPKRNAVEGGEKEKEDVSSVKPVPESGETVVDGEPIIDMEIFQQILELDEEGSDEFSREMVEEFFAQAKATFLSMEVSLAKEDLSDLSSLGHFLKGSSAALGVCKVQKSCEKMQHYGQLRDEEGLDISRAEALRRITPLLKQVRVEYDAAEKKLREYYLPS